MAVGELTIDTIAKRATEQTRDDRKEGARGQETQETRHEGVRSREQSPEEIQLVMTKLRGALAKKRTELQLFADWSGPLKALIQKEAHGKLKGEYDELLEQYQKTRDEYVGNEVSKFLDERRELVSAFQEAGGERQEHALAAGYKWLGEQNLAKLLGEGLKLQFPNGFERDHPLLAKLAHASGRALSLRMALSLGLLGAGFLAMGSGAGLGVGLGIWAGRAFLRGVGGGVAAHDILRAFGAKSGEGLKDEKIATLNQDQVEKHIGKLETAALLHGNDLSKSDTYQKLLSAYEKHLGKDSEKSLESTSEMLARLSRETDIKRERLVKEKGVTHRALVGITAASLAFIPGSDQLRRAYEGASVALGGAMESVRDFLDPRAEAAELQGAETRAAKAGGSVERTVGAPGSERPGYGEFSSRWADKVQELKAKTVQLSLESSNGRPLDHALNIADIEQIRNCASWKETPLGEEAGKLLKYIDRNSLLDRSGIRVIELDSEHPQIADALSSDAATHAEEYRDLSVQRRVEMLSQKYGVSQDALKIQPHTHEKIYISKEGTFVTREESLWNEPNSAPAPERPSAAPASTAEARPGVQGEHGTSSDEKPEEGRRAQARPRGEQSQRDAAGADETLQEGVAKKTAPEVKPGKGALKTWTGEVFTSQWENTPFDRFVAAAQANPDEFLRFYHSKMGEKIAHFGLSQEQLTAAVKDPSASKQNVESLMGVVSSRGVFQKIDLTIGGKQMAFEYGAAMRDAVPSVVEAPSVASGSVETAKELQSQTGQEATKPTAPEVASELVKKSFELTHKVAGGEVGSTWKPEFEVTTDASGTIQRVEVKGFINLNGVYANEQLYGFAPKDYWNRYGELLKLNLTAFDDQNFFKDLMRTEAAQVTHYMEAYRALAESDHPKEAAWMYEQRIRPLLNRIGGTYGREIIRPDTVPSALRDSVARESATWPSMEQVFAGKTGNDKDPLWDLMRRRMKALGMASER